MGDCRAWAMAEKAPVLVYAGAMNGSPAKNVSKKLPSDKKSSKKVPSESNVVRFVKSGYKVVELVKSGLTWLDWQKWSKVVKHG